MTTLCRRCPFEVICTAVSSDAWLLQFWSPLSDLLMYALPALPAPPAYHWRKKIAEESHTARWCACMHRAFSHIFNVPIHNSWTPFSKSDLGSCSCKCPSDLVACLLHTLPTCWAMSDPRWEASNPLQDMQPSILPSRRPCSRCACRSAHRLFRPINASPISLLLPHC